MKRAQGGIGAVVAALLLVAACASNAKPSSSTSGSAATGKIDVVVAESSWGSIAAQLGDDHVNVTSIITNPDTDPHDYEPTAQDGRAIADADYVVFNGVGYDPWVSRSIDANPSRTRKVLEVGQLLELHDGDNPHRWYFPDDVEKVIAQITHDYESIMPAATASFAQLQQAFESTGLQQYKQLLGQIEHRFAGTPVGGTESIFVGLADATGLDLRTPSSFLTAISEGNAPTARDKAAVDALLTQKKIAVFMYNPQNSTPDVQALVDAAHASGIAVVTMTETPPAATTFQDWQSAQLQQLLDALAGATGK